MCRLDTFCCLVGGVLSSVLVICERTAAETLVDTVPALVAAVNSGNAGDVIHVAPGLYELPSPLKPKTGMTILGAGLGQTTLTAAPAFVPTDLTIRDNGTNNATIDSTAYLFSPDDGTSDLTIAGFKMTAPGLHGAFYGNNTDNLTLRDNEFNGFRWSAVRTFRVNQGQIHDNEFIDAGGRRNLTSGDTAGAIYNTFFAGNGGVNQIYNNRFSKTEGFVGNFFGIKGRQFRDTEIFNNTIETNFAIELPFENDFGVEIHSNYLDGVVSIPKGGDRTEPQSAGGVDRPLGEGVLIQNNYFTRSYSIEGPRRGVAIDSNLFDFKASDDVGNLVAIFGSNASSGSPGPWSFTNNRVRNPGRGIFWSNLVHNNLVFANNHIIADETEPYTIEGGIAPGLIGLKPDRTYNFTLDPDPTKPYRINVGDEQIAVDSDLNVSITTSAGPITVEQSEVVSIEPDGTVLLSIGVNQVTLRPDGTGTVEEFTEFDTVTVSSNRIEVLGDPRPLFRNTASYSAVVENNELINIEDAAMLTNPATGEPIGPTTSGRYLIGADGEFLVDGFSITESTLPGDFNADGTVDAADYTLLRASGGRLFDTGGYELWRRNYGASLVQTSQLKAIPEPCTIVLLVSVLYAFVRERTLTAFNRS